MFKKTGYRAKERGIFFRYPGNNLPRLYQKYKEWLQDGLLQPSAAGFARGRQLVSLPIIAAWYNLPRI